MFGFFPEAGGGPSTECILVLKCAFTVKLETWRRTVPTTFFRSAMTSSFLGLIKELRTKSGECVSDHDMQVKKEINYNQAVNNFSYLRFDLLPTTLHDHFTGMYAKMYVYRKVYCFEIGSFE